jgi:tRNA threonylcarbamoyl adenosine modification protein YeaZ
MPGLMPGIDVFGGKKGVNDRDKPGHDGGRLPRMRVLAIDTALEACSAAVFDTDAGVLARESKSMTRGHAEALMPLLWRVMEHAALDFAALDRIAVTVGPGSFTGLRVGIAAARGIALAAGKPAVGITTLSAFAAPLFAADDSLPVVVAIDARHGHVYLQVYGPGGRSLVSQRLAPLRDLLRVCGASGAPRLVGTAAALVASEWPARERPPLSVDQREAPDIDWIAQLGAAAPEPTEQPKPLYLRAPDAQRQHGAQIARR